VGAEEHGLARLQCLANDFRMQIMACCDEHRVDGLSAITACQSAVHDSKPNFSRAFSDSTPVAVQTVRNVTSAFALNCGSNTPCA
jgi:hypothetical protein